MFQECSGLIVLEDFFWDKFHYRFTTYEDLLKQDFVSFEGNGYSAKFWVKYKGEEFLFKETDEFSIFGELFSFKVAKLFGIPCAEYRACRLGNATGVLSKKVYGKNETLILGAQIIQEFFTHYSEDQSILELLQDENFRRLYGIPDNLMSLKEDVRLKYVYNNLNNLEQLWRISEGYFGNDSCSSFMLMSYLIETFLFDVFLMQEDRHIENWGIIKRFPSGMYSPCPLYDNAGILGINPDPYKHINKVQNSMNLLENPKISYQFQNIFYEGKMLLTCSEDDIINAKARKRKNNMEVLCNFLKVSDQSYLDIFYYLKGIAEAIDARELIAMIELENGITFSSSLKDFMVFAYYKNLEYINEMLNTKGFRRA